MVLRDVGEPRGAEQLATRPHTTAHPDLGRGVVGGGLVSEWQLAGANHVVKRPSSV